MKLQGPDQQIWPVCQPSLARIWPTSGLARWSRWDLGGRVTRVSLAPFHVLGCLATCGTLSLGPHISRLWQLSVARFEVHLRLETHAYSRGHPHRH